MDCILALDKEEEFLLEGFRDLHSRQKDRLIGYLTAVAGKITENACICLPLVLQ